MCTGVEYRQQHAADAARVHKSGTGRVHGQGAVTVVLRTALACWSPSVDVSNRHMGKV
jgi:hypothetical protein